MTTGEGVREDEPAAGRAAAEDGNVRILIVRLGPTSDVVLDLPVLHALRESFPDLSACMRGVALRQAQGGVPSPSRGVAPREVLQ